MARFGKKQPSAGEHWAEVTAEIRDVKYGLVRPTTTGHRKVARPPDPAFTLPGWRDLATAAWPGGSDR